MQVRVLSKVKFEVQRGSLYSSFVISDAVDEVWQLRTAGIGTVQDLDSHIISDLVDGFFF